MAKPRAGQPLPSPLDAVIKSIESGTVGGRGGAAPGDAPGQPDTLASGQQGNRATGQEEYQGARAAGQPDTLLPGYQGSRVPGRQGARVPGQRLSREGWQPRTIYLPPDLHKWLKIFAVTEEREMGEIVAEALREYRANRQRG